MVSVQVSLAVSTHKYILAFLRHIVVISETSNFKTQNEKKAMNQLIE